MSLVPLARAPPNGCCPTTAPVGLSLMYRLPAAYRSVSLAQELAFDLRKASPALPKRQIPEGHTADSWLRVLAERGFAERYAGVPHEAEARERLEHELRIIAEKDFAGYFVIVHDIVAFARERGILCQGRGSAASSAVCYALGITAVDAVFYRLPFRCPAVAVRRRSSSLTRRPHRRPTP